MRSRATFFRLSCNNQKLPCCSCGVRAKLVRVCLEVRERDGVLSIIITIAPFKIGSYGALVANIHQDMCLVCAIFFYGHSTLRFQLLYARRAVTITSHTHRFLPALNAPKRGVKDDEQRKVMCMKLFFLPFSPSFAKFHKTIVVESVV